MLCDTRIRIIEKNVCSLLIPSVIDYLTHVLFFTIDPPSYCSLQYVCQIYRLPFLTHLHYVISTGELSQSGRHSTPNFSSRERGSLKRYGSWIGYGLSRTGSSLVIAQEYQVTITHYSLSQRLPASNNTLMNLANYAFAKPYYSWKHDMSYNVCYCWCSRHSLDGWLMEVASWSVAHNWAVNWFPIYNYIIIFFYCRLILGSLLVWRHLWGMRCEVKWRKRSNDGAETLRLLLIWSTLMLDPGPHTAINDKALTLFLYITVYSCVGAWV